MARKPVPARRRLRLGAVVLGTGSVATCCLALPVAAATDPGCEPWV